MSNGVGRGRGWLKLKTQIAKNPGLDSNSSPQATNHSASPNFNMQDNRTFSNASNDYDDLISKIRLLNINDDGIKFNQKIKFIVENWNQDCRNGVDVEQSFEVIHDACLEDADLATKLVLLIASRTFLSQEIHQQNIRLMFLRKLQDNFEGSVNLQTTQPNLFRNSVQLMGEFFNKARLANGQQFSFMATPLLSYLEMLLETAEPLDLKLFAMQFYLNGNSLKQESPEKVADILGKLRLKICTDKRCTKEAKLWLLLALEVSDNRFSLLPADIQKFYQEQLGDHAMACFQGSHGVLTVQTVDSSKTLDSYQSNVNVLQVSTDSHGEPAGVLISGADLGSSADCSSSGFKSDHSQNSSGIKLENSSNLQNGVKSGRPILGVGARLQRNRNQGDAYDNWETEKSNIELAASNWKISRTQANSESGNWHKNKPERDGKADVVWRDRDNQKVNDERNQKKDWDKKKVLPKLKKGWEHDDRFETDYS